MYLMSIFFMKNSKMRPGSLQNANDSRKNDKERATARPADKSKKCVVQKTGFDPTKTFDLGRFSRPPCAFLGFLPDASLGVPGPPWAPRASLGPGLPLPPWTSLGLPGSFWASLRLPGPPWTSPWESPGLPGLSGPPWPPWGSMSLPATPGASLGLPGPPCASLGLPEPP